MQGCQGLSLLGRGMPCSLLYLILLLNASLHRESGLGLLPHEKGLVRGSSCLLCLIVVHLTRVFCVGLELASCSLSMKMGRWSGPRASGPGYPQIQYTDSSPREPGPLTRPQEGAKGQPSLEATGSANSPRQQTWSGGHVEMQRPMTRGAILAGEAKRRMVKRLPMCQKHNDGTPLHWCANASLLRVPRLDGTLQCLAPTLNGYAHRLFSSPLASRASSS
jgi:hypothetical protein